MPSNAIKKKFTSRERRAARIRKKVTGTEERPRLTVFRSSGHMYAQVVNDTKGVTLAHASTLSKELKGKLEELDKTSAAKLVGTLIAEKAKVANVSKVVFDRNGFPYHGRIAAVADAARAAGLEF